MKATNTVAFLFLVLFLICACYQTTGTMKTAILRYSLITVFAFTLFSGCSSESTETKQEGGKLEEVVEYFCPMECEGDKVYHEPGDCPVCGMELSKRVVRNLDMTSPET